MRSASGHTPGQRGRGDRSDRRVRAADSRAYKRLDQVVEAHSSTVRILYMLNPAGVAMAGANEFDPYKD